jgi:hypothetical protein
MWCVVPAAVALTGWIHARHNERGGLANIVVGAALFWGLMAFRFWTVAPPFIGALLATSVAASLLAAGTGIASAIRAAP